VQQSYAAVAIDFAVGDMRSLDVPDGLLLAHKP
jgi:hypothetical protein